MKLKKILTTVLSLVLVVALTVAGTLAYLTDRDSKANVFTVGDVEITLEEEFEQGAQLVPGVNIGKMPKITNTGTNNAWVWMTFAIPTALDNWNPGTEEGSNENIIHWNPLGATTEGYVTDTRVANAIAAGYLPEGTTAQQIIDANATWDVFNALVNGGNCYKEKINEIDYNVYVIPYNKALEPGETTLPSIYNVFLDARVDIDPEGNWYTVENGAATKIEWNSSDNGNPVVFVSAYAIQKDGFASVEEAYAAYQTQWGTNGSEYAEVPTVISNIEELEEAIENGGTIVLLEDVNTDTVEISDGTSVTVDFDGNVITTDSGLLNYGDTVLENGKLVSKSTGYVSNTRENGEIVLNDMEVVSSGGGVNVWNKGVFNSGTITTNSLSTNPRHVFYVATENGHLTINDGEFIFSPTNLTRRGSYICADAGATVIVNGGTFHKPSTRTAPIQALNGATVTIYGGTFAFDPSEFVAEGYEATEADGWWTVSAK